MFDQFSAANSTRVWNQPGALGCFASVFLSVTQVFTVAIGSFLLLLLLTPFSTPVWFVIGYAIGRSFPSIRSTAVLVGSLMAAFWAWDASFRRESTFWEYYFSNQHIGVLVSLPAIACILYALGMFCARWSLAPDVPRPPTPSTDA